MKIQPLDKLKVDEKGSVFLFENYKFITRKAGTISGESKHIPQGKIILLNGKAEIREGSELRLVEAPVRIVFSSEDHAIKALTDVQFLELEE